MIAARPCPWCGHEPTIHTNDQGHVYVTCWNRRCWAGNPTVVATRRNTAVQRWNERRA